jgi:hypothetical protein
LDDVVEFPQTRTKPLLRCLISFSRSAMRVRRILELKRDLDEAQMLIAENALPSARHNHCVSA